MSATITTSDCSHIVRDKQISICDIHDGTNLTVGELVELTMPKHGKMARNLRLFIGATANFYETGIAFSSTVDADWQIQYTDWQIDDKFRSI